LDELLASFPALAIALVVCLAGARLSQRIGVPKVTIFLLAGVVLGPNVLVRLAPDGTVFEHLLLHAETEHVFDLVSFLAVGFILFRVGAEFRLPAVRRFGPRILMLAACEIGLTYVLVAVASAWSVGLAMGCVMALLATSSAPSATLLTLSELEAEGPSSRSTMLLVGLNNLFTLLAFPVVLALAVGGNNGAGEATGTAVLMLGFGAAVGALASIGLERFGSKRDRSMIGVLAVLACLGVAFALDDDSAINLAMLGCFAAGVVVTNASPHAREMFASLEAMVYPLYVLFFVGSGRELHLEAVAEAGVLGIVFVVTRILGKTLGARLGLLLSGWREELPAFLGSGLLCQAGVALGLVHALEPLPGTHHMRSVALASVVLFELIGPWLTRRVAIRAGEVKLASLLPNPDERPVLTAVRDVGHELRRSVGSYRRAHQTQPADLTVGLVMRRRPETLPVNLDFDHVLRVLAEADIDLVPVLDEGTILKGVIEAHDVREILYDPALRGLVIAADLMSPIDPLSPETPLTDAMARLDNRQVHSWPVVEDGKFVGILKRRDAYAALRNVFRYEARQADSPAEP